jgi:hypothetical protein
MGAWLQVAECGTVLISSLRPLPPLQSAQQHALWLNRLKVGDALLKRLLRSLHVEVRLYYRWATRSSSSTKAAGGT